MAQVNNLQQIDQFDLPTQIQRAARIAWLIFGGAAIVTLIYTFVSLYLIQAWQVYSVTAALLVFTIIALTSVMIIQQRRPVLGIWLIIGAMCLLWLFVSTLVSGSGVTLVVSLPLLTIAIVTQVLPQKHSNWAILVSIGVSMFTFLLDWVDLGWRFPMPETKFLNWGAISLLLVIFGFYIVRQFQNYSLRGKLIIAFIFITIVSVGLVAISTNLMITNTLQKDAGLKLKSIADLQAVAIGDLLARQLDILQSLSLSSDLQSRLLLGNTRFGKDPAVVRARLQELDQEWINAADDNFLVRNALRNFVSTELERFGKRFPEHIEIFITDKHGGLLAATDRLPNYYYADEAWWQAAYNDGLGAVFIDLPIYDKTSGTFNVVIALPIYDDRRSLSGILRSTYRLTALENLIRSEENEIEGLHTDLLFPGGDMLEGGAVKLKPIDSNELANLEKSQKLGEDYSEFDFERTLSFVSQSQVIANTGELVISRLGWLFIAHQEQQKALALAQTQTSFIILIGLGIAAFAVIVAVFVAQRLANPIIRLTAIAQQVTGGDLSSRAKVESGDEIGILAMTFNSMTDQLRTTVDTLEEQVEERTQQLETVVDIGQRLSGILDVTDLMRQVVILTKETFGYYHVHIYLIEGEVLIMTEGYGEAGVEMKRRLHHIALSAPKSLVARAAREGTILIVKNVRKNPDWLPNPLLPDTYSEMVVPVILNKEVVGVLDVQSEKIDGFTTQDETTLRALAGQVAVAIRNARLFTKTQEALYEAQRLQQTYTSHAWQQFSKSQSNIDYEVRQSALPPLEQINTPEAVAALEKKETVTIEANEQSLIAFTDYQVESQKPKNALATPLKLRDEIIGVLGIQDENANRHWTEDEIALIESVSEQMSLAIENARLFGDTQKQAQRETLTRQIVDKIRGATSVEEILQTSVAELSKALGVSRTFIDLNIAAEDKT